MTVTEPLDSSAAIISLPSSAIPMWNSPIDLLPTSRMSPGWIVAAGTFW